MFLLVCYNIGRCISSPTCFRSDNVLYQAITGATIALEITVGIKICNTVNNKIDEGVRNLVCFDSRVVKVYFEFQNDL